MLLQLLLQLIHINRIAGNTLYNLSINFSAERCYLDPQSSVIHIGHLVVIRNRQRILMGLSICLQLVFMNMVIRIMLKAQNITQLDYFIIIFFIHQQLAAAVGCPHQIVVIIGFLQLHPVLRMKFKHEVFHIIAEQLFAILIRGFRCFLLFDFFAQLIHLHDVNLTWYFRIPCIRIAF